MWHLSRWYPKTSSGVPRRATRYNQDGHLVPKDWFVIVLPDDPGTYPPFGGRSLGVEHQPWRSLEKSREAHGLICLILPFRWFTYMAINLYLISMDFSELPCLIRSSHASARQGLRLCGALLGCLCTRRVTSNALCGAQTQPMKSQPQIWMISIWYLYDICMVMVMVMVMVMMIVIINDEWWMMNGLSMI